MKGSLKKRGGTQSWMAKHLVEDHNGEYQVDNPLNDWIVTIDGVHRKALNRQVKESINIKKAKGGIPIKVGTKKITVSKEVFNTKEEFYSHTNEWDSLM